MCVCVCVCVCVCEINWKENLTDCHYAIIIFFQQAAENGLSHHIDLTRWKEKFINIAYYKKKEKKNEKPIFKIR